MRFRSCIAAVALAALLTGCFLEVLTSTAVQSDLQAKQATAAKNTLDRVKNDTGQTNLQRAVDLYQADTGSYPESLDKLVPNYIDAIPRRADGGRFGYNPVSGDVLADDSGPAPADYLTMERIKTAINGYGHATGYYPPTLDALAEAGYLGAPPRTADGRPFLYNNQTGAVKHPLEAPASTGSPTPARRGGGSTPVGGGGPLGEVTTGIAIQQELNSNSNAGTSAASARGRSGARDAASQQNERHQKALEDLGL